MTKKDYELIARVLDNRVPDKHGRLPKRLLVEDFVLALKVENARFDANKFKKACGSYDTH